MKNYMEEIEEIHPCIEIHEKIIDDNNNDEIVDSLINGNFNQAVDFVIEYGFYAKDLREFIDDTMEYNDNSYFKNEDFYQLIESATKKRQQKNKEQ